MVLERWAEGGGNGEHFWFSPGFSHALGRVFRGTCLAPGPRGWKDPQGKRTPPNLTQGARQKDNTTVCIGEQIHIFPFKRPFFFFPLKEVVLVLSNLTLFSYIFTKHQPPRTAVWQPHPWLFCIVGKLGG